MEPRVRPSKPRKYHSHIGPPLVAHQPHHKLERKDRKMKQAVETQLQQKIEELELAQVTLQQQYKERDLNQQLQAAAYN